MHDLIAADANCTSSQCVHVCSAIVQCRYSYVFT